MRAPSHFGRVLVSGFAVVTVVYIVTGQLGYMCFGDNSRGSVTLNLPTGGSHAWLVLTVDVYTNQDMSNTSLLYACTCMSVSVGLPVILWYVQFVSHIIGSFTDLSHSLLLWVINLCVFTSQQVKFKLCLPLILVVCPGCILL
jgi:hypothetical protein